MGGLTRAKCHPATEKPPARSTTHAVEFASRLYVAAEAPSCSCSCRRGSCMKLLRGMWAMSASCLIRGSLRMRCHTPFGESICQGSGTADMRVHLPPLLPRWTRCFRGGLAASAVDSKNDCYRLLPLRQWTLLFAGKLKPSSGKLTQPGARENP